MNLTQESVAHQLAEVTATSEDGDHLILIDKVDIVLTQRHGGIRSAKDASAYLDVGEWVTTHSCSTVEDCILWSHVSDPVATVVDDTEDEEDQQVRKASRPSLATLYKRARQTGLVPASTAGYF
jgi:hypothetical protein